MGCCRCYVPRKEADSKYRLRSMTEKEVLALLVDEEGNLPDVTKFTQYESIMSLEKKIKRNI